MRRCPTYLEFETAPLRRRVLRSRAARPDEGPWHSFPSGHTAGSVAVARAVGRLYPEVRTAAYAGAAAVALVQIPRWAHYAADVVAGALVGVVAEAAINEVANYLLPQRAEPEIALRAAVATHQRV